MISVISKGCNACFLARGDKWEISRKRPIIAWARESTTETDIPQGTIIEEHMVWVKRQSPCTRSYSREDSQGDCEDKIAISADKQVLWEELE